MIPRRIAPIVLLALLAAVPASAGAANWSPPAAVPGSVDGFPAVAFSPAGRGLVTWSQSIPPAIGLEGAEISRAGVIGSGRVLLSDFVGGDPGLYNVDQVIVAGTSPVDRSRGNPVISTGRAGGSFRTPRSLTGSGRTGGVGDLAVNRIGDAVAAITICAGTRCRLRTPALVFRQSDRPFGRPVALVGAANVSGMAAAINLSGRALVAWEEPIRGNTGKRAVFARIRSTSGRLGPVRRLGTATPTVRLSAALTDRGQAVVAWLGQAVSEGDALGDATIRAAVAKRGDRFGAARTLEVVKVRGTGRYVGQRGVKAIAGPDGSAQVVWTGHTGSRFVVRAAAVSDSRIAAARTALDPGSNVVLSDAELGPRHELVVLGLQNIAGADPTGPVAILSAAAAPFDGAFGPPDTVWPAAENRFVEAADAAIDPVSGRVVAVWRDLGSVTAGLRASIGSSTRVPVIAP